MKIGVILENKSVELIHAEPGAAHDAWTNVTYHGDNLFQIYVDAQDKLSNQVHDDHQECYLGYSHKHDTFYSGFDTWPEDDDGDFHGMESVVLSFKIDHHGNVSNISHFKTYDSNFYGKKGGYKGLKKDIPDIDHIRLD